VKEDYSQPEFYRFNEDSTALVKYVAGNISQVDTLLDACCGCGVIGIELARLIPVKKVLFCELQPDFISYVNENIESFLPRVCDNTVYQSSLESLNCEKVDLILMNPPYFFSTDTRPSPDARKNMCRILDEGKLTSLLRSCIAKLKENGRLYFILRKNTKALDEIHEALGDNFKEVANLNGGTIFYFGPES
jgi:tRNA1(Val) A37 N6-methylase TrmN6